MRGGGAYHAVARRPCPWIPRAPSLVPPILSLPRADSRTPRGASGVEGGPCRTPPAPRPLPALLPGHGTQDLPGPQLRQDPQVRPELSLACRLGPVSRVGVGWARCEALPPSRSSSPRPPRSRPALLRSDGRRG